MTFLKSVGAILAGILVNVILALGTDQLFHVLGVYPPWGVAMNEPGDNLLALAYRCVYGVAGAYVTAWLAPSAPIRHALILGAIGLVVSLIGVMASMQMNMGPVWYPAMVAAAALPCSFLGGYLFSLKKS